MENNIWKVNLDSMLKGPDKQLNQNKIHAVWSTFQ